MRTREQLTVVLGIFAVWFGFPWAASAQNTVRWTTNYYTVTGATVREVRRSMNGARPWGNKEDIDAMTAWSVNWSFTSVPTAGGCRPHTVTTVTTVTTTLPRYVPSTNAPVELRQRWAKYFGALARHEAQHAAIALAAGREIQSCLHGFSERSDCDTLTRDLNAQANAMMDQRRREERELDQRTRHGTTDGARFP